MPSLRKVKRPAGRFLLLFLWAAPIIGATSLSHLDDAAAASELELSRDEITRLEEPYLPHLAGSGYKHPSPREIARGNGGTS